MPLSWYTYDLSLASLAESFTNLEDLTYMKTPHHVHFCTAKRQIQQWNEPTHGGKQSTKFEPCVTRGLTCSLKRMKRDAKHVHVHSTCTVPRAQHVRYAPQISFLFIVMILLFSCTNVQSVVPLSQKFHKLGRSHVYKVFSSGTRFFRRSSSVAKRGRAFRWWLSVHKV